ncbi:MAG TPA: pYEATS domain-containing protein [Terriglobales bacterium]|nr:pYEATS domain-containing protein [Terriglobales bacterium]
MKLDDAQLRTMQRRSQTAALLSLLVFLAAIGYSYYHLRALQRRSAQLEQEIARKESRAATLDGQLQSAQDKLNAREQEFYRLVQAANRSEEKLASIDPSLLLPKAKAVPVAGSTDSVGRQIYDFSCWLQVPEQEKQKIAQVRYEFDHPTFRNKVQSSSDAEHNYQVSYRGWGALRLVTINVDLKNGSHIPIYFDMYQALNGQVPDKEVGEKIPQK